MAALAIIGAVASLASGVVGAIGAVQSANANAQAAEYDAAVKERNRKTVINQAEAEIGDKRRENRRQLAAVRAAYGSSGLTMEGSPLDVLEDSAFEQELDVERTRYGAELKSQGLSEDAVLSRMKAQSYRKSAPISAAASILGGVSSAGSSLARVNW